MKGDLISRSALLEEIKRIGGQPYSEWETLGVLALAERIPAVDAVELVRCKDCYYWLKAKVNRSGNLVCPKSGMEIVATDFCSRVERRKRR